MLKAILIKESQLYFQILSWKFNFIDSTSLQTILKLTVTKGAQTFRYENSNVYGHLSFNLDTLKFTCITSHSLPKTLHYQLY